MFKLNQNYEVDLRMRKKYYISYPSADTSTTNTPNSQIYSNLPREDSVDSSLISYLELNFEVIRKIDNSRHGNGMI